MTNLEAKQETIKNAYGEYWEAVKDFVDENGWIDFLEDIQRIMYFFHDSDNIEIFKSTWRPKSLQGIENNNGWIKIQSEKDLPNNETVWICANNNRVLLSSKTVLNWVLKNPDNKITHYKPIEKPLKPLY